MSRKLRINETIKPLEDEVEHCFEELEKVELETMNLEKEICKEKKAVERRKKMRANTQMFGEMNKREQEEKRKREEEERALLEQTQAKKKGKKSKKK